MQAQSKQSPVLGEQLKETSEGCGETAVRRSGSAAMAVSCQATHGLNTRKATWASKVGVVVVPRGTQCTDTSLKDSGGSRWRKGAGEGGSGLLGVLEARLCP